MQYLGIDYELRSVPPLDDDFIPFGVWAKAYLKEATIPFRVAVERENNNISVFSSKLRSTEPCGANLRFVERYVKFLLWSVGGKRVFLCGCDAIAEEIRKMYHPNGTRAFDVGFMNDVFEVPFEIVITDDSGFPQANETTKAIGGHLNGCRIGFDAGGSDRKVSAVIDGETVYSEEVVWFPKLSEDPNYQFNGILDSFRTAASKLPRVDAIGVSSAGVFVGNSPMVSSLFIKVPRSRRDEVKSIYDRAAKEIGEVPIIVANDGDVSALAGAMSLNAGNVMGLAMGTSEAVGYVNEKGHILGWFNELAFAPVDLFENAMRDEWSGDIGVGCKYFSQDAVIRLAERVGLSLNGNSPAEKLKAAQALAESGNETALDIFRSIGVYLAHTLVLYSEIYDLKYLLVLGRVASGTGGNVLMESCHRTLKSDYPELAESVTVMLPDEKARRVGQSIAAASLPEV